MTTSHLLSHGELIRDGFGRAMTRDKPMPQSPLSPELGPCSTQDLASLMYYYEGSKHEPQVPRPTGETQTAADWVYRHVHRCRACDHQFTAPPYPDDELAHLERVCAVCNHDHDGDWPCHFELTGLPAIEGIVRVCVEFCEACGSKYGSKRLAIECRSCGHLHYDGWEEDWEHGESVWQSFMFKSEFCKNCGELREY